MSIFVQNGAGNQSNASQSSARQEEYRRQLNALSSWPERLRQIEEKLQQTSKALALERPLFS
jgi:hypothetical protein